MFHCNTMKHLLLIIFSFYISEVANKPPVVAPREDFSFLLYFYSRYRGICVGNLISQDVALTASVCVANVSDSRPDKRSVTIIVGSTYRHVKRGIHIPVYRIIMPKLPGVSEMGKRGYALETTVAVLLLKRRVPNNLFDTPMRSIAIDYSDDTGWTRYENCLTAGWHFFYKGDVILPGGKFFLQRLLRMQVLTAVDAKKCEGLLHKMKTAIQFLGYDIPVLEGLACLRDSEEAAQPCHGMYGSPLLCRGKLVGMLMAPDAQWVNCTGHSAIFHSIKTKVHQQFFDCIKEILKPSITLNMNKLLQYPMTEKGQGIAHDYELYDISHTHKPKKN